jgi:hypothetical protein
MFKKVVVVLAVAAVFFASCGKRMSKEEMTARGEYLVKACGVLSIYHTPLTKDGKPDFTKFMAGSTTGYQGPWGVAYPKNLTPDIDTGIGASTDEEVIAEIKGEGVSKKPPMFSEYYKNLTDEDLKCIVTYLRSLPPVPNKIPEGIAPGEPVRTPVISLNVIAPKAAAAAAPAKKAAAKPAAKKAAAPAKKTTTKKK